MVDFNVAKKVNEGDNFVMFTKSAGTLAFTAPERLRDNCVYTEKVDMWAMGIVLFMLLVGSHPFESNGSTAKLFEQILNGQTIVEEAIQAQEGISLEAKNLVC